MFLCHLLLCASVTFRFLCLCSFHVQVVWLTVCSCSVSLGGGFVGGGQGESSPVSVLFSVSPSSRWFCLTWPLTLLLLCASAAVWFTACRVCSCVFPPWFTSCLCCTLTSILPLVMCSFALWSRTCMSSVRSTCFSSSLLALFCGSVCSS